VEVRDQILLLGQYILLAVLYQLYCVLDYQKRHFLFDFLYQVLCQHLYLLRDPSVDQLEEDPDQEVNL
jgi:hypothetical protein